MLTISMTTKYSLFFTPSLTNTPLFRPPHPLITFTPLQETSTTGGIEGLKDDDGAGAARITFLEDSLSCLQLPSVCGFIGHAML